MSTDATRLRLESLLGESPWSVRQREDGAFDRATQGEHKPIVLWGAGRLGQKLLSGLRTVGVHPIAFCDSNPALVGTQVMGLQVLAPPEAAAQYGRAATFVITIWGPHDSDTMRDRERHLAELGCTSVVPFSLLFWKYAAVLGSYYAFTRPSHTLEQSEFIRRAYGLWADEDSRAEYVAQVDWRLTGDFGALHPAVNHEIYFPEDLVELTGEELFVDCGAYDGDTIRSLFRRNQAEESRVVAFEPDPATFQALSGFVASLPPEDRNRIEVHQVALGETRSLVQFDPTGTEASVMGQGNVVVECVRLDEILDQRRPTFIKMDIEGAEPGAIAGAAKTIRGSSPVLAVCLYHEFDHLWRIPLAISELSDQYRFYLRPHHSQAWDLVCYAIPQHRLKDRRGREQIRS